MGQSGFDRAIEEEERRRRRLREAEELEVSLDDDEIDELCRQMKDFLQRGRGEGGKGLTFQAIDDYFRERLDDLTKEPTKFEAAVAEALGRPPRRRRRGNAGRGNAEFIRELFTFG
jgi:hypothetical protein